MQKQRRLTLAAMALSVLAVAFGLAGSGRVIADALKDVFVANTAANPIPVQNRDEPARQPFQHFGTFTIADPASGGSDSFAVPAGKRLVIEYVSFRSNILTGGNQIVSFSVQNQGGGSLGLLSFVPEKTIESVFNTTGFIAHEQVRAYCDPGTNVNVTAIRNSSVGSDTVSYSFAGYFVDLP
jgi:hypothetical protein